MMMTQRTAGFSMKWTKFKSYQIVATDKNKVYEEGEVIAHGSAKDVADFLSDNFGVAIVITSEEGED